MRLFSKSPSVGLWAAGLVVASGCSLIASPDESLLDQASSSGGGTTTGTPTSSSSGATTTTTSSSNPSSTGTGGDGGGGSGQGGDAVSTTTSSSSDGGGGNNQGGGGNTQGRGGNNQGGGGNNQGGGGAGQGGGGAPPCVDPEVDCDPTGNECEVAVCDGNGECSTAPVDQGVATVLGQVDGNCQVQVCDGDGGTEIIDDDLDTPPVDPESCVESWSCDNGDPVEDFKDSGQPCGAGGALTCNAIGVCGGCDVPADCGADEACRVRTCSVAGECGFDDLDDDTPVPDADENCQLVTCQGGQPVISDDDGDIEDDDNDCTTDSCDAGSPDHDPRTVGASCTDGPNGAGFCIAGGDCRDCALDTNCGVTDICKTNTCNQVSFTCDATNFVPAGTEVADPVDNDCLHTECSGPPNGNILLNEPEDAGTTCGGGNFCDAAGNCLSDFCDDDADCNPFDTVCTDVTCNIGTNRCTNVANINEGGLVGTDTTTDCVDLRCQAGVPTNVNDDTETPTDDADPCTQETCSGGVAHPPVATHSACEGQAGFCDADGDCVECTQDGAQCPSGSCNEGSQTCDAVPTLDVSSTIPAAGDTNEDPLGTITVNFSLAIDPATITLKSDPTTTTCTGSVQVSEDDFATCITLDLVSAAGTAVTVAPAPAMSFGRPYKIRVTTAVETPSDVALSSQFTLATAFTTQVDNTALVTGGRQVVISQVYGGSGSASPAYNQDFVELHNRGNTAVDVTGWAVQYAATSGNFNGANSVTTLAGSIPAGGYYLVALDPGNPGTALPTPDASGLSDLAGANGKVALTNTSTALTGSCPTGGAIVDFVGYGTANCFEGAAATAVGSALLAPTRIDTCGDSDANSVDFQSPSPAPNPRNTASAATTCTVRTLNESGIAREIDACSIEQASLAGASGSTVNVSALVTETGVTDSAGAGPFLAVQFGTGPRDTNPETETGLWTFVSASYLTESGGNDQWGINGFTLPAAGTYGYAFRVTQDGGVSWTYCDVNGAGTGANNFEITNIPTLVSN